MKIKDLYKQVLNEQSVCLEVGVFLGENAQNIFNHNPKKLYLVDPWENQVEKLKARNVIPHSHVTGHPKEQEEWFQLVTSKFSNNKNVDIIRKYSVDAAELFNNNYFDFIYIDALHDYESVRDDINAWNKKLKTGGMMVIDDYQVNNERGYGVIEATDEFLLNNSNFKIYKKLNRSIVILKMNIIDRIVNKIEKLMIQHA